MSEEEVPLVELLDRLLDTGAAVEGDLVVSVADVDLVWLGLRAVLGGIEHAPAGARLERPRVAPATTGRRHETWPPAVAPAPRRQPAGPAPLRLAAGDPAGEPERLGDGLVRLVMSVVELLRQLLERQALRRVEDDSLSDEQAERLGLALLQLSERMEQLKEYFGLHDEDLGLSLGLAEAR